MAFSGRAHFLGLARVAAMTSPASMRLPTHPLTLHWHQDARMIEASDIEQRLRTKYQEVTLKEYKALREALIGSQPLLEQLPRLIEEGGSPADLKEYVLDTEGGGSFEAWLCLGTYIWELTVGCVALIHKGSWDEQAAESAVQEEDRIGTCSGKH